MDIKIHTHASWNNNALTLVEEPSGMGDTVLICIHDFGEIPPDEAKATVRVLKSDLIRAAKMLDVPYTSESSDGGDA